MWSFLRGCVRLRDSQIIPVVVHALVHKWAVQQLITVLYWCFHSLYLCHKASTGLGSAGSNTAYKPLDSISCWKKHFWNCLICPKPKHSADYYNLTCHPSIILAALHLHARILHLHSCFHLQCCSLEAAFHFYLCCCCCRRTSILIWCCGEKCVKAFLRVCVCEILGAVRKYQLLLQEYYSIIWWCFHLRHTACTGQDLQGKPAGWVWCSS